MRAWTLGFRQRGARGGCVWRDVAGRHTDSTRATGRGERLSNPLILFRKRGNSSWIVVLRASESATVPMPCPGPRPVEGPDERLDHEKLDVYVALAEEVVERLPRGRAN
jgi:hypothetical protein